MAGWTNLGKMRALGLIRGDSAPTNFYVALVTGDDIPDADTNVLGDLTEIAAGNGYTAGGFQLDRNSTDFDTLTEDDGNDLAFLQVKDVTWTASTGPIPSSGNDASYAVLTDDDGTLADREVWYYWDLGGSYGVSDTQDLTLVNLEIRVSEPSP